MSTFIMIYMITGKILASSHVLLFVVLAVNTFKNLVENVLYYKCIYIRDVLVCIVSNLSSRKSARSS